MQLDLLVHEAKVITMDPRHPHARSVGIWQGRIVGFDNDVDELPARRRIGVGGATVLPALLDPHVHLTWAGLNATSIDLRGSGEVNEIIARLRAGLPADGDAWVEASGYDQRPLGRHLTCHDIEQAAPGRRVLIRHTSGHAVVVSASVLAAIGTEALAAAGANVGRDVAGRPTGLLLESALRLAMNRRMPYSTAEIRGALAHSAAQCARQGITFCAEAGIGGGLTSHSAVELAAFQDAVADGLPLRVQTMVSGEVLHKLSPPSDGRSQDVSMTLDLGMRSGFGSDRLQLGAIKLFLDGGMMARTAALSEPYCGVGPGQAAPRGALTEDLEGCRQIVREAHRAGWQLALHAIGDRAVDVALDLIEEAQRHEHRWQSRHRIEHCGLVRPDQLPRLAALSVTAVIQPAFLTEFGDDYANVLGPERAVWLYRGRSFLEHGIAVAGSSDRPVTDGNPFVAMAFMVSRQTSSGQVIGAGEAVTVEEAFHAYTVGAARACHVEHELGSLRPGSLADLMVLDRDPFTAPAEELAQTGVDATLLGGELVHDRRGLDG